MMQLITPEKVIELAFSTLDQITAESIKRTKIDAVQERFLRPSLGDLYLALQAGRYPDFLSEYIQPALAYFVRYAVIPDVSMKLGDMGLQMFNTAHSSAGTDKQRSDMRQQALSDANALFDRATRYLTTNNIDFPEYTPCSNVREMVSIKGDLIL